MRKKTLLAGAIAVGLAAATVVGGGAAGASTDSLRIDKQLKGDFAGPLQIAVGNGKIYVADSFRSALFSLGDNTPIATGPDPSHGALDGVGINRDNGDVAYTQTDYANDDALFKLIHNGRVTRTVDVGAYERSVNPDRNVTYGVVGSASSCAKKALAKATGHPAVYTGVKDSHPYAVGRLLHNNWAVADAAGNDILRVDSAGHVSTLAVLPAQQWTITKEFAQENNAPDCVVGVKYRFESVPTDVELGPDGNVYVTTLPGGEIPNQSRLYRINIHTGAVTTLASGFANAINLAVVPNGDVYVSELATGNIQLVRDGHVSTAINLPGVAGLQWANGALYAATAPGLTGSMDPGHVYRLVPNAA